jgi:predicted AAA+ superfamily ATPase
MDAVIGAKYHSRVVDEQVIRCLSNFGGVLITGPKWCGKTWTGAHHSGSMTSVDEKSVKEMAILSPETVLAGDSPRLIDEWQDAPGLWDAARRRIDISAKTGLYIFTGSSTPLLKQTSHTGTGRFATVRMRPLSLFESGNSNGRVSLAKLFDEGRIEPIESAMSYGKAVDLVCMGGWPASHWSNRTDPMEIPREYVKSLISYDVSRADGVRRDPARTERILKSLARNTATSVAATTIAADISGEQPVSEQTVRSYVGALRQLCVIEEQPAWMPSARSRARVRTSPKMHFTDPSLAAAMMNAGPGLLMSDPRTMGFLFESLCYRDLCVYASASGGAVYHYRDSNGLEADAVIELPDGRWGAVEVKLGNHQLEDASSNLIGLGEAAGSCRPPSFLAVVSAAGGYAYTRKDGVSVIPIDCLGP